MRASIIVRLVLIAILSLSGLRYIVGMVSGGGLNAVIYGMTPTSGSTAGGTLLTITGVNFMRDGTDGETIVFLANEVCEYVEYYSTDTQYVCYTPPTPLVGNGLGAVPVVMVTVGTGYGDNAVCNINNGLGCQFTYSTAATPAITQLTLGAAAGGALNMYGYLIGDQFPILEPMIGAYNCPTTWTDAFGNTQTYNIQPLNIVAGTQGQTSNGGTYPLWCLAVDQPAARLNFTLLVQPLSTTPLVGNGQATLLHSMYQVNTDGSLFNIVLRPAITSVSPNAGGVNGGGVVTIVGTSFGLNCSALSVMLGGQPATVQSCNGQEIVVVPSANTDYVARNTALHGTTLFGSTTYKAAIGQNGVRVDEMSTATGAPITLSYVSLGGFATTTQPHTSSSSFSGAHLTSLFVAPYTALYQFYCNGDMSGTFKIGSDSSTSNLTLACSYSTNNQYYQAAAQVSPWYSLTAGTAYAVSGNFNGIWSSGYDTQAQYAVAVRIQNSNSAAGMPFLPTDTSNHAIYASLPTIQNITISSAVRRAIQTVSLTGFNSGFVQIAVGASGTAYFDIAAYSASQVASSVQSISGCSNGGSVQVVRTVSPLGIAFGITFTITWNCPSPSGRALLTVNNVNLTGNSSVTPSIQSDVVQTASIPLGGYFTLGFGNGSILYTKQGNVNGDKTGVIAPTASSQTVHDQLVLLTPLNQLTVGTSGNGYDSMTYFVTFYDPSGPVHCLDVDGSRLTGDGASISCSFYRVGSNDRFINPIPSDWLFVPADNNQVTLQVNGVDAICQGNTTNYQTYYPSLTDCAYLYETALTPTLSAVAPSSWTAGTTLTLSGAKFNALNYNDNVVKFLPAFTVASGVVFPNCQNVTVSTDGTTITCIIPDLSAGEYVVQVQVLSRGATIVASPLSSASNLVISGQYVMSVSSYYPTSGSTMGGSLLFIYGTGFHIPQSLSFLGNDSFVQSSGYSQVFGEQISIGTQLCVLEDVSFTRIICRVPAMVSGLSTTQPIYNGLNALMGSNSQNQPIATFFYDSTMTPQITSITPTTVSSAVASMITIIGSGFVVNMTSAAREIASMIHDPYGWTITNHWTVYDNSLYTTFAVHFGSRSCNILTVNSTTIICMVVAAPPPNNFQTSNAVAPNVYVLGLGYANANSHTLDIALRISSITPNIGSLAGGQVLTITGAGFVSLSSSFVQININPYQTVTASMNPQSLAFSVTPVSPSTRVNGSWAFLPLTVYCDIVNVTFTQIICITEPTNVLPQDFLGNSSIVGTTHVTINSISSVCTTSDPGASCLYGFAPARTPIITSTSPATGGAGTVVTISGAQLSRAGATVTVYIGYQVCPLAQAITANQIICTAAGYTAGAVPIQVLYSDVGFAAVDNYNRTTPHFTNNLYISSMSFNGTSYGGGVPLTIRGNGFSPVLANNVVAFGPYASVNVTGQPAVVISASYSQLVFMTPPSTVAWTSSSTTTLANFAIGVTGDYYAFYLLQGVQRYNPYPTIGDPNPPISDYNQVSTCNNAACAYTYSAASTPHLSAISPTTGTSGTTITVTGRSFGAYNVNNSVEIGGVPCAITSSSWSATSFTCVVGVTPAGKYGVVVTIYGQGAAYVDTSSLVAATTFTSQLAVNSIGSQTISGYGGGVNLIIRGSGFAATAASSVVNVCNAPCTVVSTNFSTIVCTTTTLNTLDRMRAYGAPSVAQAYGTPIGNMGAANVNQLGLVFDGNVETYITSSSSVQGSCWIGMDMGDWNALALTSIQYFAPWTQATAVAGGSFQVSNDLHVWTAVANISSNIYEAQNGWSYFTLVDLNAGAQVNLTSAYRYIRYVPPPGGACAMAELQFIGFVVANNTLTLPATGVSDSATCPVLVSIEAPDLTHTPQVNSVGVVSMPQMNTGFTYTYHLSTTPLVSSITPNNGSSLGGTVVTIGGTGFTSAATVALSGYPCIVSSVASDGTSITCTTTARSFIGPSPTGVQIAVYAGSYGNALLVANPQLNTSPLVNLPILPSYRYLDRWSALNTWTDNIPPAFGDEVVIPEGQTILMDVSPPQLSVLLIQGVLIWDTTQSGLQLNASYIWVNGGTFQLGTEQAPMMNKATITLFGDRLTSVEIPYIGSKVFNVGGRGATAMSMGGYLPFGRYMADTPQSTVVSDNYDNMDGRGILDIHGAPRVRVWTKVASTVAAGSRFIYTSEPVDFAPNENIVLTSGSGDMWETEVLTVQQLINPTTIQVTSPIAYEHLSYWYNTTGYSMDMRCEVGLLTRNILVQGEPISSDYEQFGAHTMMTPGGIMRIENAEYHHCGQSFNLGRYCLHFHMAGDAHESYLKSNSIHHSFQRATTVHGTQLATVQNEFAYDVKGHTFFVEDGAERQNLFEGNLGVLTQPLYSMLASDSEPSTFWMSSPMNMWRHNVAAGSAANGFWFQLSGSPGGPSYTTAVCPVQNPLGQFFNNTAKNNNLGLKIYPQWTPMLNPCSGDGITAPQYLYNTTSFRNSGNGIFGKHLGDIHHINIMLAENGGAQYSQVHFEGVAYNINNPNVVNALIVASTSPTPSTTSSSYSLGILAPQEEFWSVQGAVFVNFANSPAMAGCNDCDSDESFKQGGYMYRSSGLQWVNSNSRLTWSSPYKEIWHDMDGTLTGYVNGQATPYYAFNVWPECPRMGANFSYGIVCNGQVRVRRLQVNYFQPTTLAYQLLKISGNGGGGSDFIAFRPRDYFGWSAPVVANKNLNVTIVNGNGVQLIDWTQLTIRYSEPQYIRDFSVNMATEFSLLSFPYIDYRFSYKVTYPYTYNSINVPARNFTQPGLLGAGLTTTYPIGTSITDTSAKLWNVIIDSTGANATDYENSYQFNTLAQVCPPAGCPLPSAGNWTTPVYWSQASSWAFSTATSGLKPIAGQNVEIPSYVWMVIDEPTAQLGQLKVDGYLQFQDNGVGSAPLTLDVMSMVVYGLMTIGSAASPYAGTAIINLRGNRYSPTLIVDNSQSLGNKALFIGGQFHAFGTPVNNTWTRLLSTAAVGVTSMQVVDGVDDWPIGSNVSISSTEYDITQEEVVMVTSIDLSTNTIHFTPALKYRHFGGDVTHGSQYLASVRTTAVESVHLGAVVALLSRNVVIQGDSTGADGSWEGYGGQVFVSEIPNSAFQGTINAQYIQFDYMGQLNMTGAGLYIHYFTAAEATIGQFASESFYYKNGAHSTAAMSLSAVEAGSRYQIIGCAFSRGNNYGIQVAGAQGVLLDRNTIHNSQRFSIGFGPGALNGIVTNNAVVGSYRSPADFTAVLGWQGIIPMAAVYLTVNPAQLTGNVVAGAQGEGFTMRLPSCGTLPNFVFGQNEVISAMHGIYILPDVSGVACVQLNDVVVWKSSSVAVLSVDLNTNVQLNRVIVSDSHIGISLEFSNVGDPTSAQGLPVSSNYALISQSAIMGSTAASTCSASLQCVVATSAHPFVQASDNIACGSVFGSTYRRIGLVSSQYLNIGRTCEVNSEISAAGCTFPLPLNMPVRQCAASAGLLQRYGLPSTSRAQMNVSQTVFANWAEADCGLESAATAWSPLQPDFTPLINVKQIGWYNTDQTAKLSMRTTANGFPQCNSGGCDGLEMMAIRDEDGTFTGYPVTATGSSWSHGHTVLSGYQAALATTNSACQYNSAWNAYYCLNSVYRQVIVESEDIDRGTRNLQPVIYTPNNVYLNSSYEYFSEGPFDDECPIIDHFAWFPTLFAVNQWTDIFTTGTPPNSLRITIASYDPNEKFLISVFYTQPFQIVLFRGGVAQTNIGRHPTLADPVGSYVFDPQARRLFALVAGGGLNSAGGFDNTYDLIANTMIQVTMTLAVDYSEFDSARVVEYLSLLLSINPSQIRIASVHAGSTVASLNIVPVGNLTVNTTSNYANIVQMNVLAQTLKLLVENGTQIGYPVESITIIPPPLHGANSSQTIVAVPNTNVLSSGGGGGLSGAAIGGIVVGVVIGICCLAAAVALICYNRRKASELPDTWNQPAKRLESSSWNVPPPLSTTQPSEMELASTLSPVSLPPLPPTPAMVAPALPRTLPKLTPRELGVLNRPAPRAPALPASRPKLLTPSRGVAPPLPSSRPSLTPPKAPKMSYAEILRKLARDAAIRARARGLGGAQSHPIDFHYGMPHKHSGNNSPSSSAGSEPKTPNLYPIDESQSRSAGAFSLAQEAMNQARIRRSLNSAQPVRI